MGIATSAAIISLLMFGQRGMVNGSRSHHTAHASVESECDLHAPRSGAGSIARGARFLRTPGNMRSISAPRTGCEESSTPFQGAVPVCAYIPEIGRAHV